LKVKQISRHRNGITGVGFHAVTFSDKTGKETEGAGKDFLAIVFDTPKHCAVINLGLLPDVEENRWRGDYYEDDLRKAIAEFEDGRSLAGGKRSRRDSSE